MIGPNQVADIETQLAAQLAAQLPEGIALRGLTNYGICLVADLDGVESGIDLIGVAAEAGGGILSATEGEVLVSVWHGRIEGVPVVARHESPLGDFADED